MKAENYILNLFERLVNTTSWTIEQPETKIRLQKSKIKLERTQILV